jgi:hypothetical protein
MQRSSEITAIVGWFEVEMTKDNWLSTSPFEPPTHWKQVVLPIIGGQKFSEGAKISGNLTCKPISTNYRGLDLALDFANLGEERPLQFNYLLQ